MKSFVYGVLGLTCLAASLWLSYRQGVVAERKRWQQYTCTVEIKPGRVAMIDTLPPVVQRRYIKRPDLVTDVEHLGGRITITRVTPVKRVLFRDRWWYNGRGWEKISTGKVLHAKE